MSLDTQEQHEVSDLDSILKKIADIYSTLTPQLTKAADYVLDNPIDIALLPIRKSSEAAGVTPSTLTRLAKILGFERYNNFKEVFKQSMHTKAPVNFGSRAQSLQALFATRANHEMFHEFAESTFKGLDLFFNDKSLNQLQVGAEIILQAKNVYALGLRDTFACAYHFNYVGSIAFPNFHLIRGNEGNLINELSNIDRDDVVIAFGSSPYSIDTVKALDILKRKRVRVMSITDDMRSPLVAASELVFIVNTETPHFFPSIVSTITLIEALLAECISIAGSEIVDNIKDFEDTVRSFGGYYSV